jgi:hypothetical protein
MSSSPGFPEAFVYVTVNSPLPSVVPLNDCAPETPLTVSVIAIPTTGVLEESSTLAVTLVVFCGSWTVPADGVIVTVCGTGGTLAHCIDALAMMACVRPTMSTGEVGPSIVKSSVKCQMAACTAAASSPGEASPSMG